MSSLRRPRVSRDLLLSCAFFSGRHTPHPSPLHFPVSALSSLIFLSRMLGPSLQASFGLHSAQASPLWEWAVCTWLFEALFPLCFSRGLPIALVPCRAPGYEGWGCDSLPSEMLVQTFRFSLACLVDFCHIAIIKDE